MKINTIVAEYNPFHNGHAYHIAEAAQKTGADYTIVIMSGNYVQRGAPAVLDKFTRARMALQNGADLCLELPTYYAASSAEYFATGAVTLAEKLGVVTHLCFGTECDDLEYLKQTARILVDEPEEFCKLLAENLREGLSFPMARQKALLDYSPDLREKADILECPNNILGLEYIKALYRRNSNIEPISIPRIGKDYLDESLDETYSSARALRKVLGCTDDTDSRIALIENQVPENVYPLLQQAHENNEFLFSNDFSTVLHYKLLNEQSMGFEDYLDVSYELSGRIQNHLYEFQDYEQFCDLLNSKDMTYTRISRCLLHILLDMKKYQMTDYQAHDYVSYARILGFRKESTPLLSAITQNASIPLLSKPADAKTVLDTNAYAMLMDEVRMSDIYQSILSQKSKKKMAHEFRTPLVIL